MKRVWLHLWVQVAVPMFLLGSYAGATLASLLISAEARSLFVVAARVLETLTLAVALATLLLLVFRIATPLQRLIALTHHIEAGHVEVRYGSPHPKGPIGILTRAFDRMAEALEARQVVTDEALSDQLTGLPNRRAFFGTLEQAVEEAERGGPEFDVCFVDVDEFKSINDQFGHAHGDLALQDVAHVLRHRFGESGMIARIGGDEFAVIYAGADRLSTEELSNEVGLLLAELSNTEERPCAIEVSIGVATYVRGDNADALMQHADRSMYRAKRARAEQRSLRRVPRSA